MASFHVFFSNSLFTIAQSFDILQSKLLIASLNKVQTNVRTPVTSFLQIFIERFARYEVLTVCVAQPKSLAITAKRCKHWCHSLSNVPSDHRVELNMLTSTAFCPKRGSHQKKRAYFVFFLKMHYPWPLMSGYYDV